MRTKTMMNHTVRAAMLGVLLAGSVAVARAAEDRPLGDDQCSAQCDEASDKCNVQAGKDKDKRNTCDKEYDSCLAKCKN